MTRRRVDGVAPPTTDVFLEVSEGRSFPRSVCIPVVGLGQTVATDTVAGRMLAGSWMSP